MEFYLYLKLFLMGYLILLDVMPLSEALLKLQLQMAEDSEDMMMNQFNDLLFKANSSIGKSIS